uniref:Thrombospondin-like N-terminal domain-containing protein n=1 Tax=Hucho hucho TaxID=62062 RepID=A0A4W5KDK4_9TELE
MHGNITNLSKANMYKISDYLAPCFRSAYPLGLPEEFEFVTVLRMNGSTVTKNWNFWLMQDLNGEEQLAVRLNGESLSLEFTFTTLNKTRETAVFPFLPFLFNSQWHSILLKVNKHSVTLFVDCIMVDSQNTPQRGIVNLDGYTLIGKLKDNPVLAVPFELQSMHIHCDVGRPRTCNDLSARTSRASGPVGPPGPAGVPGIDGVAGERGDDGEDGPAGPDGDAGKLGSAGLPGEPGADVSILFQIIHPLPSISCLSSLAPFLSSLMIV